MLSGESLANRQALFQVRPNAEFRYNLAASSISTAPPPGNKSLPFQQVALMRDRPRKTYMDFLFQWFGEVKIRSMIFSTSGKKNPQQLAQNHGNLSWRKMLPWMLQPGQGDGSRRMFRATPKASWWDVEIFDFSRLKVIHLGKLTFWTSQKWRFGSDDFPFQVGDSLGSMWIFRGVIFRKKGLVLSSWCVNQPIWKICSSNGIISLRFRGESKKK